jgi:hypothetical protein
MDGRGDDVGVAGGAGLGRVEVCAAWAAGSVKTAPPEYNQAAIRLLDRQRSRGVE